jgi:hypothetical protein
MGDINNLAEVLERWFHYNLLSRKEQINRREGDEGLDIGVSGASFSRLT